MTPEIRMPPGVPQPAGLHLTCPRCGQRNCVPTERLLERPQCGRCKLVVLEPGREVGAGAWALAIALLFVCLAAIGALVGAGIAVSALAAVSRGAAGGMAAGLGLGVVLLWALVAEGIMERMARALVQAAGRRW